MSNISASSVSARTTRSLPPRSTYRNVPGRLRYRHQLFHLCRLLSELRIYSLEFSIAVDDKSAPGLPSRTTARTVSFEQLVFFQFSLIFVSVPLKFTTFTNPRWRTTAILKIEHRPYYYVPCARLSCPYYRQLLSARKCIVSYRSYREVYKPVAALADPRGGGMPPPLAAWAYTQNALKVAIFRLKIEKKFLGRGQCPLPRPQLVFLCINLITT